MVVESTIQFFKTVPFCPTSPLLLIFSSRFSIVFGVPLRRLSWVVGKRAFCSPDSLQTQNPWVGSHD